MTGSKATDVFYPIDCMRTKILIDTGVLELGEHSLSSCTRNSDVREFEATAQSVPYIALLCICFGPSRNYNTQLQLKRRPWVLRPLLGCWRAVSVLGRRCGFNHRIIAVAAGSRLHLRWPTWHIIGPAAAATTASVTAIDQSTHDDVLPLCNPIN